MVARAAIAMENRILVFMCRVYVVIILQISPYYSFGGFQCVFLVFCLVQYVWVGFRICLNVFPYVQMLGQVVTVRGFLVNFGFQWKTL